MIQHFWSLLCCKLEMSYNCYVFIEDHISNNETLSKWLQFPESYKNCNVTNAMNIINWLCNHYELSARARNRYLTTAGRCLLLLTVMPKLSLWVLCYVTVMSVSCQRFWESLLSNLWSWVTACKEPEKGFFQDSCLCAITLKILLKIYSKLNKLLFI